MKKKKSKRCRNYVIVSCYFSLILIIACFVAFYPPATNYALETLNTVSQLPFGGHVIIVLIGVVFVVFGLPVSLFELFLGYFYHNFFYSLLILFMVIIIS